MGRTLGDATSALDLSLFASVHMETKTVPFEWMVIRLDVLLAEKVNLKGVDR